MLTLQVCRRKGVSSSQCTCFVILGVSCYRETIVFAHECVRTNSSPAYLHTRIITHSAKPGWCLPLKTHRPCCQKEGNLEFLGQFGISWACLEFERTALLASCNLCSLKFCAVSNCDLCIVTGWVLPLQDLHTNQDFTEHETALSSADVPRLETRGAGISKIAHRLSVTRMFAFSFQEKEHHHFANSTLGAGSRLHR